MPAPHREHSRRASADAVLFDAEGRILLQRRADNGAWCLPGGSIEVGETAAASVVREVREESGLIVEPVKLVGLYSDPLQTTHRYPDGNLVHYVSALFECRVLGGRLRESDESTGVGWFDPNDLPRPFLSDHTQRIRDALERRPEAFFR